MAFAYENFCFVFLEWGSLGVVLIEECDLHLKNNHREGEKPSHQVLTYVKNKVINKIKMFSFYALTFF